MARSDSPYRPRVWRQAVPDRAAGRTAPARRPPPAVPPGSLAASVVAAGLEDVDLGLERLPPRRSRAAGSGWTWLMALSVALIAVAGILWLWQPTRAPAARPPAAEHPAAAAPSAPADQPRPGPGGLAVSIRPVEFNYTVAPGDTLERIAQRYGTTVDAIVGMNNLSDRNVLQPGQKLIIP